jgi:hypothetical protein
VLTARSRFIRVDMSVALAIFALAAPTRAQGQLPPAKSPLETETEFVRDHRDVLGRHRERQRSQVLPPE